MDNYEELPRKHINYVVNGKVMLCAGIFLFMALLIILCFHKYAPILFRNSRRAQHLPSIATATPPTTVASKGLDLSVIKTIPTFFYSTKASHLPPLECAVCLSEFENDEKARVLPMCNHTFHVDCIDMWFYSHSNCPLCRAPVRADIPVNPPTILEQTVVAVAESVGSETSIETNSSPVSSSSSSLPSPLMLESCPMKALELLEVGILVEVPTGEHR
ncbi:RING-H2 finger protein ATL5-like [Durio zibethinus]|uniref:RING-type E3 ubiquitin transferase n=1 Tax=Durio zibethinus TaxID=66656 RepID=A0A6P5XKG8_DURZI|nr:RING-H2 finger protein ATL5-like [Durio zibethinus]